MVEPSSREPVAPAAPDSEVINNWSIHEHRAELSSLRTRIGELEREVRQYRADEIEVLWPEGSELTCGNGLKHLSRHNICFYCWAEAAEKKLSEQSALMRDEQELVGALRIAERELVALLSKCERCGGCGRIRYFDRDDKLCPDCRGSGKYQGNNFALNNTRNVLSQHSASTKPEKGKQL